MDRRIRTSALLAAAALLFCGSVGCRTTRDEVPPSRRHRQKPEPGAPAVEFSTEPRAGADLAGMGPLGGAAGNVGPTTNPGYGASGGGLPPYGAPTGSRFGPPGTAGAVPGSDTPGSLLGSGGPGGASRDPAVGTSVFGRPTGAAKPNPNPFEPGGGLPLGVP